MPIPNPSCIVASPRECNRATSAENATADATASTQTARKPASLQELRAQLRAQLTRNQGTQPGIGKDAELRTELRTFKSATAWRWLLHYPAGTQEVRFLPEVTRAQALASCPGSIDAEAIADDAKVH